MSSPLPCHGEYPYLVMESAPYLVMESAPTLVMESAPTLVMESAPTLVMSSVVETSLQGDREISPRWSR